MANYPAGKIDDVEIQVNDWGEWVASVGGRRLRTGTRAELEKKVKAAKKALKVPVEVLFTVATPDCDGRIQVEDGWATGLHATTGKALLRFASGKRKQDDESGWGWRNPVYYVRLSEDEKRELERLHINVYAANKALEAFSEVRILGPIRGAVEKAIAEKQKETEK